MSLIWSSMLEPVSNIKTLLIEGNFLPPSYCQSIIAEQSLHHHLNCYEGYIRAELFKALLA